MADRIAVRNRCVKLPTSLANSAPGGVVSPNASVAKFLNLVDVPPEATSEPSPTIKDYTGCRGSATLLNKGNSISGVGSPGLLKYAPSLMIKLKFP